LFPHESVQQEGNTPLSTSSTNLPSAEQLAASRLLRWHQQGEALLTFENVRSWINATGLVLFTSRSQQLPAPAPSLVEAVLGTPNENPVLADTEQAKSLLARLIAEGIAVPLNLLGTPGETPDFIASAPVFAYIFTLRGDKAWKQPPTTSGALKVSPLALATYTLLAERITMSAYDLTTQLGKEVTESAVLRALNELWVHLRVLPIPQPDGAATLWELTSGRFTKLMKAGANAGQPSALSALISLYLNTAVVATEEEIETFLSPLAARSRIRDVVHALMSARQLETIAVEGKTVLHVTGELPGFLAPAGSVVIDAEAAAGIAAEVAADGEPVEGALRITKFVAKPRKIGTGFLNKAVGKPAFGARPSFGTRPAFGSRPASGGNRDRRPFERNGRPAAGKPSFTKPWQEEKAARPAASTSPEGVEGAEQSAPRFDAPKPRFDRGGDRPSFGRKPSFGGRPSFGRDRDARPAGGGFAGKRRDFGEDRPPRREFTPRPDGDAGGARPPRKPFVKFAGADRPRSGGFAGKPSFGRDRGDSRPPRKDFGDSRPPRRDFGDSRPPRREFAPRADREGSGDARPPRREFGARPSTDRPSFGGPRKPGSFSARPQGGFGDRKPFTPREGGSPRFGGKPAGSGTDRRARTDGPPFRKFDAPRGDRPARPARPEGGGYAGKPSGGFGGKKPFGKPGAGKPASTFDKFKNNAKPFGNRPPSRKFRPEEGESKG
jgi:23S rRNA pseudouridine2605 synthase